MLKLLSLLSLLFLACGQPLPEEVTQVVERYPERGRLAPSVSEPAQVEAPKPPKPTVEVIPLDLSAWNAAGVAVTRAKDGTLTVSAMANAATCSEYSKAKGEASYNWREAATLTATVVVSGLGEFVPQIDYTAETSPTVEVGDCKEPSRVVFEWSDGSGWRNASGQLSGNTVTLRFRLHGQSAIHLRASKISAIH